MQCTLSVHELQLPGTSAACEGLWDGRWFLVWWLVQMADDYPAAMTLFASARERRLWLWTLAVVVAIYSTLGLTGTLAGALRENGLLDASILGLFIMFLLGATIFTRGISVRPRGAEIAVMLGVTAVYLLLFLRTVLPEERTHLMEYGVLGVLIHERWPSGPARAGVFPCRPCSLS